ncbi:hypothetical protein L596_027647 [Steinernema carpocapsae]|uniref:Replication factor A C-terminal domain-containing protein n=1 Tax=Steinernema carpocapsae TaxID=34508 RepID=A0A4U5LW62_STECR|nr:hypothetical protein L596_027647 [Steinernema carpocapsae]
MDADQIGTLQSTNTEQFNQVIEQVRFRPFHFRIRSKMETFNDMQNLRWSVYDVKPVPYPEYLTVLRQSVEEMHL